MVPKVIHIISSELGKLEGSLIDMNRMINAPLQNGIYNIKGIMKWMMSVLQD